jgi:hypothetical protein
MSNDRRKIHATFPFDDVIDTTKKEQKSLKVCRRIIYLMNACLLSPELKQRITELESTNRTMKEDNHTMKENNRSMQDTINTMKEDNRSMQDTIHFMQMERLDLYIGNMLVDFVEKIYRDRRSSLPPGTGNDPSHSTTRHAQAAQQIRKKDLVEMGIAPKYYDALQMFSKVYNPRPDLRVKLTWQQYNEARNSQAHDTRIAFAKLLLSPHFQRTEHHQYCYWSGLFPICYGQTVEQVAKSNGGNDSADWIRKATAGEDDNKEEWKAYYGGITLWPSIMAILHIPFLKKPRPLLSARHRVPFSTMKGRF